MKTKLVIVERDVLESRTSLSCTYTDCQHSNNQRLNTEITVLPQSPHLSKKIQVGNTEFEYGLRIGEMFDSTELYTSGDRAGLLAQLESDGYIFLRGAIPRETAAKCRKAMIAHLAPKGAFAPGTPLDEAVIANPKEPGWTIDAETGGIIGDREPDSEIEGWRNLSWSKELRDVYAGDALRSVFSFLWGQERTPTEDGFSVLSDVTWLRAKGRGEVTAEHADYYYFKQATDVFRRNRHPNVTDDAKEWNAANTTSTGANLILCDLCGRGFDRTTITPPIPQSYSKADDGEWHCADCARQPNPVYTCWISLGDYHSGNSSLCVMPKSQALTEFHDPVKNGLLPSDYQRLVKEKWGWQRGDFSMGDIIIFNVKTVHGASKNLQNNFRFSIDTRVSARWFRPVALYGSEAAMSRPIPRAPARVSADVAARAAAEVADSVDGLIPPQKGAKRGMGMGMMGVGGKNKDSVFADSDSEEEEVKAQTKKPRSAKAMGM